MLLYGLHYSTCKNPIIKLSLLKNKRLAISVAVGAHGFCSPVPHTALVPPTIITGGP